MVTTLSRKRVPAAGRLLVPLCLLAIFVSGCGAAHRLHADYTNYEAVYADTSNREMLLNLARLDQHDPTFFFKMGQIGTQYQMSAGLSGSGNYMIQGTGSGGNAIGGGTPTLTYSKNPTFQFIPVNDDTTAQLLLKPVDPEYFYDLYQQGWRVDQLFRLMVDRIEYRAPGGPNGVHWEMIRNDATVSNINNYARFLRVSALAYDMQQRGYLRLRSDRAFVPLAKGAQLTAPTAQQILDADAKNLSWEQQQNGQWQLGTSNDTVVFELNDPYDETKTTCQTDSPKETQLECNIGNEMPELKTGGIGGMTALQAFVTIIGSGFSIEGAPSAAAEDASKLGCHLVMRSLLGVMAAAAQEQDEFETLAADKTLTVPSDSGPVLLTAVVPPVEMRPILHLKLKPTDKITSSPLVELTYENEDYVVANFADQSAPTGTDEDPTWNRDVFRLISQLIAQVTVDISKFPIPTILQLNGQ
jgi:hypothetical protein